jgi:uncharacterized protein
MSVVVNLFLGLLFGLGLIVAGMADPAKVLNFLDITGSWDPSLAFVMGGGVVMAFIGYRLAGRRARPLLDTRFHWPTMTHIDRPLVIGAAVFGVGWGLVGLCPGPAFVALGTGAAEALVFFPAMVLGMIAARVWLARIAFRPV